MLDKHQPHDDFVERLEWQVRAEARRRSRPSPQVWWMPRSPMKAALGVAVVVILSMGIGGAAVAAAYQAQRNEQRNLLASSYERRAELARERLALARQQLQADERRVSLGIGRQESLLEGRLKIAEAEAQLKVIELQLAEVRASGREPLDEISSPTVSGRDFVGERLLVEMSVPEAALNLEKRRLAADQRRFEVGLANNVTVETAQARVIEIEAAVEAFQRKIGVRQRFVKGEMDAATADLRALEVEAEQRLRTLEPRIELAKKRLRDMAIKVEIGSAQPADLAEAELKLKELEIELLRAKVDLTVIRQKIGK